MSQHQLTPLPADAADLLSFADDLPGPSSAQIDRVYAGVAATVGVSAVAGTAAAASAGGTASATKAILAIAVVATVGGGGYAASRAARADAPMAVAIQQAAVKANRNVATPVIATPTPDLPKKAMVTPTPDVPPADVPPTPAVAKTPTRLTTPAPKPRAVATPPATTRTPSTKPPTASERALLDGARAAVARKDFATALRSLGQHRAQYPRARLAEERDAMWILTLARAGRMPEARRRAQRFRRDYASSIYNPAIDSAVSQNKLTDRPR